MTTTTPPTGTRAPGSAVVPGEHPQQDARRWLVLVFVALAQLMIALERLRGRIGRGRAGTGPHPADVAAVALVALTIDAHCEAAYQLTGPQVLSPIDELGILAEVLGRPLRAIEPPIDTLRAGMLAAGTPAPVVDAIVARTLSDDGKDVLPTVDQILGRPPATFADWAGAHARLFTEARSIPGLSGGSALTR